MGNTHDEYIQLVILGEYEFNYIPKWEGVGIKVLYAMGGGKVRIKEILGEYKCGGGHTSSTCSF